LSESSQIRVDKWLWYARQIKSRSLAQKFVSDGCVRINREKIRTASKKVSAGDVLTLNLSHGIRVLKVVACGTRRGPFEEAKALYEDISPVVTPNDSPDPSTYGAPIPQGRPDSRERLLARQLSGKE
jgi:ribosome-associated heat shock protein Hsp15